MRRSALPLMAGLALIWGSNFLWIKLGIRGMSPVELTFARFVLGAVALFPVMAHRREALPRTARLWAHIGVAALSANAVPYLLFALGEQYTASSTAAILNATTPLWTVIIALAVRHGPAVRLPLIIGLIVGFAGTLLIFSPWQAASGITSAGGIECLAAAVSYGISYVYMDRYLAKGPVPPVTLAACQLLASAVILAGVLGVTGYRPIQLTGTTIASVAILGIIGTGVAYVLAYQIITREGATAASTVTYLNPIVAIVLGVLVLNETISPGILAGIALVLSGVALTRYRTQPVQAAPETRPAEGQPSERSKRL